MFSTAIYLVRQNLVLCGNGLNKRLEMGFRSQDREAKGAEQDQTAVVNKNQSVQNAGVAFVNGAN